MFFCGQDYSFFGDDSCVSGWLPMADPVLLMASTAY